MFDDEFEQTRDYLKSKIGEYLRDKGININAKFRCLNPAHPDMHPSMSYNIQNHTVHCFSCNATYDIFDLVGIDYNLPTFKDRLNKLKEMYLTNTLNNMNKGLEKPGSVTFGISNDNSLQRPAGFVERPSAFANTASAREPVFFADRSSESGFQSLNDEKISAPPTGMFTDTGMLQRAQGVRFGQEHAAMAEQTGTRFETMPEKKVNFAAYLKQCKSQVGNTDYFALRGISREVVEKFSLGYDDKFDASYDHNTGEGIVWRAAIIPYSDFAYMARNTDLYSKDRIIKRGKAEIFNAAALNQPGPVFVTEGEFDALSLETLGYNALSLGGVSNVRSLLEKIQESNGRSRIFYLCLDNDDPGFGACQQLMEGLKQMQIPYKRINISFPYKDPNEALVKDRQGLLYRLQNLEKILSYSLKPVFAPRSENYIKSPEQLQSMNLSQSLYAFCGQGSLVRTILAKIIKQSRPNIVYASNMNQWQQLCNSLYTFTQDQQVPYNSLVNANAQLLEIKDCNDLKDFTGSIETSIAAYRVQNENMFTLVVDLLSASEQQISQCANFLGNLSYTYQQAVIILAHEKYQDLLEGNCMQVLNVTHSSNGIKFATNDQGGFNVEFSLPVY